MTTRADEEEEDEFAYLDEGVAEKLRAQGAAQFGQIIRTAIGDQATAALEEQVAAGANDPLTAIEAKPPESRNRDDWGQLYGSGRCDYESIPEDIRRQMDLRA